MVCNDAFGSDCAFSQVEPPTSTPDCNLHKMSFIHTKSLKTKDKSVEKTGEILDDRLQGGVVRSFSLVPEEALRRAEAIDVLCLDRPRMAAVVRSPGSCEECKRWNSGRAS